MIHKNVNGKAKCGTWASWKQFNFSITDDDSKVDCRKCLNIVPHKKSAVLDKNLVGRIIHDSWGYDMTFNEFWKIVRQTRSCVWGVKIGSKKDSDSGVNSGWSGREIPDPDKIVDPTPIKFAVRQYAWVSTDDHYIFKSDRYSAGLINPTDSFYWNRMD